MEIWGNTYERKVDLPQLGSPRSRMVTVGGSAIDGEQRMGQGDSDLISWCRSRIYRI